MSDDRNDFVMGRATWLLKQVGKRIWVRAVAFSLLGVATAVLAAVAGPHLSLSWSFKIAGKAVSDLLNILASSMLAVTSFSLSIMVNAFSAASQSTTPRATQLLITDSVATTTLSTFVGTFLFAIVGIIGLSADLYDEQGRVILLGATVGVVVAVAATLLRWIDELGYFGRVESTIERVEAKAVQAASNWGRTPRLGALEPSAIPSDAQALRHPNTGHLRFIDIPGLQELAEEKDLHVHIACRPGSFLAPDRPFAYLVPALDEARLNDVLNCFEIERQRTFEQDPRFGLTVLSEIASKALSPGINDPGTAISIVQSGLRTLLSFADGRKQTSDVRFERVSMQDVDAHELVEDFVNPIARDGGGNLEVQIALQHALSALAETEQAALTDAARRVARDVRARVRDDHFTERERERLAHAAHWIDGGR